GGCGGVDGARTIRRRSARPRKRTRDVQATRSETLAWASRRSPDRCPRRDLRLSPPSASAQPDKSSLMEPRCNRWHRSPIALPSKRRIRAKTVGVGCDHSPKAAHGKEEVDPFRAERLALLTVLSPGPRQAVFGSVGTSTTQNGRRSRPHPSAVSLDPPSLLRGDAEGVDRRVDLHSGEG